MLQDPKRGISASICSHCGEEVVYCSTFCPVCGHKFVYAQLMPPIEVWNKLSVEQKINISKKARLETLSDIKKNGDWRIGCINKGSSELTDIVTKPTIKEHVIKQSPDFPIKRRKELELIAKSYIAKIEYDKEYDEYEPVFELFRQIFISSDIEIHPSLIAGVKEISQALIDYLKRHPDAIYKLDPNVFEKLVAEILSSFGFEVDLNVRLPAGEVDIIAVSHDPLGKRIGYLVECKRYTPTRKISIGQVARLYELKNATQADLEIPRAMFVTTSDFTRNVHEFYGNRWDLDLRNYEMILEWLNDYKVNEKIGDVELLNDIYKQSFFKKSQ